MIGVVHCKKDYFDVYIGRASEGVSRAGSPLANPFSVKEYGRDGCVEKYRRWLWGKIKSHDSIVCGALLSILLKESGGGDVILGCWCAPLKCHGDVIASALRTPEVIDHLEIFLKNISDTP